MTIAQELQQEIMTLPNEAIEEILDFVLFVKARRYANAPRLNAKTQRVLRATDAEQDVIACSDAEEMFAQLGI